MGSLLDRKCNELWNYFPSPTTNTAGVVTVPVADLNTKTGGHKKKQGIPCNPRTASSHSPTTGTPTNLTYPTCTYCDKVHPEGCGLKTHPDANQNPFIPWNASVDGRVTSLKDRGLL